MSQIVKLRRSSVSGQKPTNSNLQLGELALNTTDGKVYMAKSGSLGTSVEELISTNTVNTGSVSISGSLNLIGNQTITGSLNANSLTGSINYNNLTNVPTLVSGSSQISYTGITNTPSGIVSGSSQITNLGFTNTGSFNSFTSSVVLTSQTSSMTVLTSSYALTASYALNASGGGGTEGRTAKLTQTTPSSTWTFGHNLGEQYPAITVFDSNNDVVIPTSVKAQSNNTIIITFSSPQSGVASATVGGGLPFISASYDGRVLAASGSSPIWKDGIISGSSQLTGSYDTRYVLSGSITQTTWDNIANKPSNIVSSSAQIGAFGFATTGSNTFQGTQTINGNLVVTGSLTAQQFIVSSSVTYLTTSFSSGSTKFGDSIDDTHQFTGSVLVTGSLNLRGDQTITGSLNVSNKILQNGGALATQDGTILYHNLAWFTPTGTISSSGTVVTSVGGQFTSAMVGAKLTISGESRIITVYTSATQVTVDSAYSQNYSGITLGNWSVYSKSLTFATADNPNRAGGFLILGNTGTANLAATYDRLETNLKIADSQNNATFTPSDTNVFKLGGDKSIVWYPPAGGNAINGTRDLGIRRNTTGSLEIFNGSTSDGALANRRDLILRDITGSNATFSGSLNVSGSILQNGGLLAVQDGTILYHSLPWFTPTGTVSSSGTTVTSVGTQFTSAMVGSKLTISGESRIITAFTSTTQVTVASAYSQNYSGIALGSWSVYSKSFANNDVIGASPVQNVFYDTQSTKKIYFDVNGNYINTATYGIFTGNMSAAKFFSFGSDAGMRFALANNDGQTDVRLRRISSGLLQIDNGFSDTAYRDLTLRDITGSNATFSGSAKITNGLTLTGSLNVSGSVVVNGGLTATSLTGSINYNNLTNVPTLISGSSQISYTGITNIPSGLVSGSSQIDITAVTNYTTFSSSIATTDSNQNTRLTSIEGITGSIGSLNTYTGSNNTIIGTLQTSTSSLNTFTSSASGRLTSLETASGSIRTDFNSFTSSNNTTVSTQNGRLTSIESASSSIRTDFNSFTSSNNTVETTQNSRLTSIEGVTGSISSLNTYTGSNNTVIGTLQTATSSLNSFTSSINTTIKNKLNNDGVVSGSSQIDITSTTNYTTFSSSIATTDSNQNTRLGLIETSTGSLNSFTSSLNGAVEVTGSNLTVKGNLLVKGTTTQIDSTTVSIGDNIIQLNGTGATNAGLVVRDATAPNSVSGSLLWDTLNDRWIAGALGSEDRIILATELTTLSSSLNSRATSLETASGSIRTDFNSYTSSANGRLTSIEGVTGSVSSLNTYTGSNNTILGTLQTSTSSLNTFTSSAGGRLTSIESKTGSYATTGSNIFNGNQTITGSLNISGSLIVSGNILPSINNTYTLGSITNQFNNVHSTVGVISNLYINTIRASSNSVLFGSNQTNFWGGFIGTGSLSPGNFILNYATSSAGIVDNGYRLQINNNGALSGSLYVSSSGVAASLVGSGSGVFTVDGTSGRLFQIDDSLSGSLFSVNTAAGLPLMEGFSDNTVRIGQFGQKALFVSQSLVGFGMETPIHKVDISGSLRLTNQLIVSSSLLLNQNTSSLASGTRTISTNATSSFTSVFYNYTLSSGSNARAGQVIAVWNGNSLSYTDNSTTDIGTTSNIALTASLSTGNVVLSTVLPTNGWTIKSLVNLL